MKTDLSEQFEAEFSVEVEVKADLRWSESGTNSVWAQQRMGQVLKEKNGTRVVKKLKRAFCLVKNGRGNQFETEISAEIDSRV